MENLQLEESTPTIPQTDDRNRQPNSPALEVTPELPHIELPIGEHRDDAYTLTVTVDSCGGASIGDLYFHTQLYRLYPELVAEFEIIDQALPEAHNEIGGIATSEETIRISHIIRYYTPYQENGEISTILFGLCQDIALTTSIGLAFLRKTQAKWSFGDPPRLHIPTINETF